MMVFLSQEGKKILLVQQKKMKTKYRDKEQKWTQQVWCKDAHVSISTLKRFLKGESTSEGTFEEICKAVEIDEYKKLILIQQEEPTNKENGTYLLSSSSQLEYRVTVMWCGFPSNSIVEQILDNLKIFFKYLHIEISNLEKTQTMIYVNGRNSLDRDTQNIVRAILEELSTLLNTPVEEEPIETNAIRLVIQNVKKSSTLQGEENKDFGESYFYL